MGASTSSAVVKVLIADATSMLCQLLASALHQSSSRLQVVDQCTTAGQVFDSVGRYKPSIVLLGAGFADGPGAGFELLTHIRAGYPQVRVVMLLEDSDREQVIAAFRAGASGIFTRQESVEMLPRCVLAVSQGQIWANSSQLEYLLECFSKLTAQEDSAENARGALTQRENEVAGLVAQGLTNRAISSRLGLSEHTVKNYLFRIYEKLGVSNRVELTRQVAPSAPPVPSPRRAVTSWEGRANTLAFGRGTPAD
jgi:DNA-binding NarL/FixJ family response regulator